MSRVTPPVTKLTHVFRRSISSSARSASLVDQSRHVSVYLPRKLSELRNECSKRQLDANGNKLELVDRLTAHDLSNSRDFHSGHRPIQTPRPIPLMQGFRTSATTPAAHDTSTIDYCFMPAAPQPPPTNPFARLRVPLLPDNYSPDRSSSSPHAAESIDEALAKPEISVVAAHPEMVLPAMLSEVVGNDGLDVDIGQLTKGFVHTPAAYMQSAKESISETIAEKTKVPEAGFWSGIADDIFGPKSESKRV